MRNLVFVFSLLLAELFATFYAIVGIDYEGGESSPAYTIAIFVTAILTFFYLHNDRRIFERSKYVWIYVICIPLIIYIASVIDTFSVPSASNAISSNLKIALGYIVPICISSIYIAKDGLSHYSKYLHISMLLITIAVFISIFNALSGKSLGYGSANYQTLSYYSALAFNLNLCFILFREKLETFSFFNKKVCVSISYCLLLIQLAGCLISGGRGGFVYLALCSVYMLIRAKKLRGFVTIGLVALMVGVIIASKDEENRLLDIISSQSERTFSYVSRSGIDMSETSERDVVYASALNYIKCHAPIGGGLFLSRYEFGGYPHNFFLEVLMQGGYFYLVFWLMVLLVAVRKILYLVNKLDDCLLLPIVMYPFTMLLFSGTYLWTPLFWFAIVYCFVRTDLFKLRIIVK